MRVSLLYSCSATQRSALLNVYVDLSRIFSTLIKHILLYHLLWINTSSSSHLHVIFFSLNKVKCYRMVDHFAIFSKHL